VTVPAAITALALLTWTAVSLLRTVRRSVVASLPLRPDQHVTIDATGDCALSIEGPVGTSLPTQLRFTLASADGTTRIPLTSLAFRTEVTSMSRSRIELQGLTIPAPGDYVLHIDGLDTLDASANHRACAIVFARQYGVALVLHILVLIALALVLIGSSVVSVLVLHGRI